MKKIRKDNVMKKRNSLKVTGTILCCVAGIVLVIVIAWIVVSKIGERSLYGDRITEESGEIVNISYLSNEELADVLWRKGKVRYLGEVYEYNEEILTFLVLGIDKEGPLSATDKIAAGGQSDALFLVLLNPENKSINVLAIDRNLMTKVAVPGMGENGEDEYFNGQITLQYGYGDGRESSCQLTKDLVSKVLYQIPINGYGAISYSALPYLNDSVGGVEVTVTEDVIGDTGWTVGEKVVLHDSEAILYIRYRDTSVFESARMRTQRQKEYLSAWVNQVMEQTQKDITFPMKLYQGIQQYVVTDLSVEEVLYLAEEISTYEFSEIQIHTMPGETIHGEVYEEFYPDETELRKLILDLYYTPVTENEE